MKMHFNDLFIIQNGMITPKVTIQINGTTMGQGVGFGSGVSFDGVDLSQYTNSYFQVEIQNSLYIIKGIYN